MTFFKALSVLSIVFTFSTVGVIAPLEARDRPSSPPPNATANKQKAKDTAASKGITADTVKAKAATVTQEQKIQARYAAQEKAYQRINAAMQKAKEYCKGSAQCQAKVDQALNAAKAEIKKEAQAAVQWCKTTKCASDAVAAKAEQIYYQKCASLFNDCSNWY